MAKILKLTAYTPIKLSQLVDFFLQLNQLEGLYQDVIAL